MVRPRNLMLAAALLLGGLTLGAPDARAEDVPKEVRLLTAEGKHAQARAKLQNAPDEVKNDIGLRKALVDLCQRSLRRQDGEARRGGLVAITEHLAVILAVEPAGVDAAVDAIGAASELAQLSLEAKQPDDAKAWAGRGIAFGQATVDAGASDAKLALRLAEAYRTRAEVSHKINDMEQIIGDYQHAADLLEQAAEGDPKGLDLIAQATRMLMDLARFVHDSIPIPEETRDEEAAKKAVALAHRTCEAEGATVEQYTAHILALRTLRQVGVEGDFGEPYMKEVKPAVFGLSLRIPKGDGWKVDTRKNKDWDFLATRQFEGEDKNVQILLRIWESEDEAMYGFKFKDVDKIVEIREEAQLEKFTQVNSRVPLHLLGNPPPPEDDGKKKKKKKKPKKKKKKKPKKGELPIPDVWHFRIIGEPTSKAKPQQLAEFFWKHPKEPVTFQLRILDWGTPWGLMDDDMKLFLQSAFGKELWPEPKPDEGKKKKK